MKNRVYGLSFNCTRDQNYSIGIGYYFYSFAWPYRKLPMPTIETNLNYHFDKYVYHNIAIGIPLLISPKLNLSTYTDFKKTAVFVKPGIAINAFMAEINYNYNWVISDQVGFDTRHSFAVYFRLGIPKNVWQSNGDLHQSQYDRRCLKRKKRS